jgi:murein DD-endopeptidase MepM/ murein hydrolase activator NlpD
LPDPRQLVRRIVQSALPTRVIAHVTVVSLVVVTSLVALTTPKGHDGAGVTSDAAFIALISQARGAAASQELTAANYETAGLGRDAASMIDRGIRVGTPGAAEPATPAPTPVAIDPDATPLAAPADTSIGSANTRAAAPQAPTVRVAQPVPTDGALVWPVIGGSISQYYHAGHLALDIAASSGSTVVAAKAGTVTWAGWRNNGGGYVIAIDHGGGMQTVYNHLGSIWVGVGTYVVAGQGIGGVGCTGTCTGPHVHFEVIMNGVIDNPLRYL